MKRKLLLVFLLAFLLRLIALNQSLWLDEATTARVVQKYEFTQIINEFSRNDFHPPLYYLFMKAWTNVFGYSEIALRFPSVLFSLLTGYIVYLIGKKLFSNDSGLATLARMTKNRNIGMWAAVFFLFNPLIIYYSQEARMYILATFFLTLGLWSFWGAIATPESNNDSGQARMTKRSRNPFDKLRVNKFGMTNIVMFNISIFVSFLTFYGSIFLIILMILYLFYKKQYRHAFFSLFIIIFSLFIIYPLLYQQIINAKQQLGLIPNWGQVLGKANLKNLALIPLKFSIGRISFYPKWIYWGISGVWTLTV